MGRKIVVLLLVCTMALSFGACKQSGIPEEARSICEEILDTVDEYGRVNKGNYLVLYSELKGLEGKFDLIKDQQLEKLDDDGRLNMIMLAADISSLEVGVLYTDNYEIQDACKNNKKRLDASKK